MCNVALAQLAIGIDLAKAGLDDAPLLVLESLGARRTCGRWALLLLCHVGRSHATLRVHGAIRAGHVERWVGAIAHVAVAVGRRARHCAGWGGVVIYAIVSYGRHSLSYRRCVRASR